MSVAISGGVQPLQALYKPRTLLQFIVTRIVEFKVEPTVVTPGEEVRVTGRLQAHWPPLLCTWTNLEGYTVECLVNKKKVAETETSSGGLFEFRLSFSDYGVYYVMARFPGDFWRKPCETNEIAVRVVTPEEKKRLEESEMIKNIAIAVAVIGGVGIAGYLIYSYFERRRLLELLALAKKR